MVEEFVEDVMTVAVVTEIDSAYGASTIQKEWASLDMIRLAVAYEEVNEESTSYEVTVLVLVPADLELDRSFDLGSDVTAVEELIVLAATATMDYPSLAEVERDMTRVYC